MHPSSNLKKFNLKRSKAEIIFSATNAYWESGLSIPMIGLNLLWYITTPVSMIGLGVAIGSSAAFIAATAGIGVITLGVAIPITYLIYKETNNRGLIKEITKKEDKCADKRKELFYDYLRLRFLRASFSIENQDLSQLVETHYQQLLQNNSEEARAIKQAMLLPQEGVKKAEIQEKLFHLLNTDQTLENKMNDCFKLDVLTVSRKAMLGKVIGGGVIGGLSTGGAVFGSVWVVGALATSLGVAAVLFPIIGWAILALTIASVIGFGIGIGYARYKNAKRKVLLNELNKQNKNLDELQKQCSQAISKAHDEKAKHQDFNKQNKAEMNKSPLGKRKFSANDGGQHPSVTGTSETFFYQPVNSNVEQPVRKYIRRSRR